MRAQTMGQRAAGAATATATATATAENAKAGFGGFIQGILDQRHYWFFTR